MRPPRPVRVIALLVSAGALAGCTMGHDATRASTPSVTSSGVTPSPSSSVVPRAADVWSRTQQSVRGCTSVSLTGTDSADGSGPKITFLGELDGEPAEMSYEGQDIGQVTMRRIGHDVYFKGDRTYWDSVEKNDPSSKGSSLPANRWLEVPDTLFSEKDLSDISATTYVKALGSTSDAKWGHLGDGTLTAETLDGKPTYKIVSTDGDTSVWVSTDDRHDLLKVVDEAAASNDLGTATFSRWNEKIPIPRPAGALDGRSSGSRSGEATT